MHKRIIAVLGVAALGLPLAACGSTGGDAPVASSAPAVPPLVVQTVNGTGCPTGTATATATVDQVTATYTAFSATAGGTGFRRTCQINVTVTPGDGRLAEVTNAHHEGTAALPAGSSGTVKTNYYLTAGTTLATTASALAAPAWSVDQPTPAGAVVTPCGAAVALNIKTDLQVQGTGAQSTTSASVVAFTWRDC